MPVLCRESVILAKASDLQAGTIDQLNQVLRDYGLGSPLREPEPAAPGASTPGDNASGLVELPLDEGVDPIAVRDALRQAGRERREPLPELSPDFLHSVHTIHGFDPSGKKGGHVPPHSGHTVQEGGLVASGKKGGHGTISWLSALPDMMKPAQPWQPGRQPPVVAVLDTGVRSHSWLPGPAGSPPFLIDAAAELSWQPPVRIPDVPNTWPDQFGTHAGHATFLAGLIRLAAPEARVLSMQVMSNMGEVSDQNAVAALTRLGHYVYGGGHVDVVLMAFGRQADPGDADLKDLRNAVQRLSAYQVKIVVSAGNQDSESTVYPAAFAADSDPVLAASVVSVGARVSPTERAPFSNYGVWVREWRDGVNVVGINPVMLEYNSNGELQQVPGNGFTYWSGNSFAAATYAGELAHQVVTGERVPAHVAGS